MQLASDGIYYWDSDSWFVYLTEVPGKAGGRGRMRKRWLVIFNTLAQQVLSSTGNALMHKLRYDILSSYWLLHFVYLDICCTRDVETGLYSKALLAKPIADGIYRFPWRPTITAVSGLAGPLRLTPWGQQHETQKGKVTVTKCLEKLPEKLSWKGTELQAEGRLQDCKWKAFSTTEVNSPKEPCNTLNC